MRIVAGELGGRRLAVPRGRGTRPTAERTREAVFSILGEISGARVLDLFAGSGALGIEALSRGAAHATFVERAPAALAAIARNRTALNLEDRSTVIAADVRVGLRAAGVHGGTYDLVFVDPPYADAAAAGRLLARDLPSLLASPARVLSESGRRDPLDLGLPITLERTYGDTVIRIHERSNE